MAVSRRGVSSSDDEFLAAILEGYVSAADAAEAAAFARQLRGESDPVESSAFARAVLGEGDPAEAAMVARVLRGECSPREAAALAYELVRESDPARAAEILREWNFNPDELRDWRGRWTRGGSLAPASGREDDEDDGPDATSPGNPKNNPDDPEDSPSGPEDWPQDPLPYAIAPGLPDASPAELRPYQIWPRFRGPSPHGPPHGAAIRPSVRRPAQGRLRHTAVRHEPFMSDKDYNHIVRVAQNDNPPDPDTPAAKLFPTVTIAVLVEVEKGIAGIGHSAIAISKRGVGFAPDKMQFYDFGPIHNKSESGEFVVPGDSWWDHKARQYDPNTKEGTGKTMSHSKLSDVLRDLDDLREGADVWMLVTQATERQGDAIQKYWQDRIYMSKSGGPYIKRMPMYTFANVPFTLNCTSAVYNSLLAGDLLSHPALRKFAAFTKAQACNPSMFQNLLLGTHAYELLGPGLLRTAGPKLGRPVSVYRRTATGAGKAPHWEFPP